MKKVKFLKYLNNEQLTDGIQRSPDEVVSVKDDIAFRLVAGGHAVYVPEPKRAKKAKPLVFKEEG